MKNSKNKGFTLVEALIVVILIAIGGAIAFSLYGSVTSDARYKAQAAAALDRVRTLGEGANAYYLKYGRNPASIDDLVTSGILKSAPSTVLASVKDEIFALVPEAIAGSAEYVMAFDNSYKKDGTPDGIDGYIDLKGITASETCANVNDKLGRGKIVIIGTGGSGGGGSSLDTVPSVTSFPLVPPINSPVTDGSDNCPSGHQKVANWDICIPNNIPLDEWHYAEGGYHTGQYCPAGTRKDSGWTGYGCWPEELGSGLHWIAYNTGIYCPSGSYYASNGICCPDGVNRYESDDGSMFGCTTSGPTTQPSEDNDYCRKPGMVWLFNPENDFVGCFTTGGSGSSSGANVVGGANCYDAADGTYTLHYPFSVN